MNVEDCPTCVLRETRVNPKDKFKILLARIEILEVRIKELERNSFTNAVSQLHV